MLHCGFEGDTIFLMVINLETQMQIFPTMLIVTTPNFFFKKEKNVLGLFEPLFSLFVCILVAGKHNKEGRT